MAVISGTRLSAYPYDAWALAVPLDRAFLFSFRSERLYGPYSSSNVQHRNDLDGLVLAPLPGKDGRIDRRPAHGYFAVHALLRKICSRGCVYGLLRAFDALLDPP